LLVITPFAETVTRLTEETATKRNRLMMELADEIVIAHASAGGKIEALAQEATSTGKNIRTL
jgi:hypothetical protein